jgi:hypothetical protein
MNVRNRLSLSLLLHPRGLAVLTATSLLLVSGVASASPKGDVAADWFAGSHAAPSQPHAVTDPAASVTRGGTGHGRASSIGQTGASARQNVARASASSRDRSATARSLSPRITDHR